MDKELENWAMVNLDRRIHNKKINKQIAEGYAQLLLDIERLKTHFEELLQLIERTG